MHNRHSLSLEHTVYSCFAPLISFEIGCYLFLFAKKLFARTRISEFRRPCCADRLCRDLSLKIRVLQRARIVLAAKGLQDYDVVNIKLRDDLPEWYPAINPARAVPAIEFPDGQAINESLVVSGTPHLLTQPASLIKEI